MSFTCSIITNGPEGSEKLHKGGWIQLLQRGVLEAIQKIREFTHRVKSVSMAKFTSQEVESLQKGVKLTTGQGEEGHRTKAEIALRRATFTQEVLVWHKLDRPNVTKFLEYNLIYTIGIAIGSTLLGEIEGTCITCVKSEKVPHEYSTITGIQELMNLVIEVEVALIAYVKTITAIGPSTVFS
ncbi:DNA-directed RNA polymerase subunit alpha [Capsicum chinense]|nr:DNA-directed RNA polymerase subunit alpha [Capsicum chinense]